jgi:hypothetical protein
MAFEKIGENFKSEKLSIFKNTSLPFGEGIGWGAKTAFKAHFYMLF